MSRVLSTVATMIALALAPIPAAASGQGPNEPSEPTEPTDALAEAKAWHIEADAKYNTADYEGAITAWQKAFAALPRTPEANTYRSLILYNIAAAREKLFALRGDVEHLKQAKILLEQFEASIEETYAAAPEQGEEERARVEAKLETIDAQIAQQDSAPPPVQPPPPELAADPPATDSPTSQAPAKRPAKTYFIVGGVLAGLGVAAGAGMASALVIGRRANDIAGLDDRDLDGREQMFDRGRRANVAAFVTGTFGAACLAAGVAMLVIGAKRRDTRTAIAPVVSRGLAGVAVGGRF